MLAVPWSSIKAVEEIDILAFDHIYHVCETHLWDCVHLLLFFPSHRHVL